MRRKSRRDISGEDHALWRHATRHVRPLAPERPKPARKKPVEAGATKPAEPAPSHAPSHPPKPPAKLAKNAKAHAPKPAAKKPPPPPAMDLTALDGARARKLKRGELVPQDRIDLHGATEAVAHRRLETFVLAASAAGLRVVLVITGKGAGGRGILRELVPRWLKEARLRPHVVAVTRAAARHGGDGALYLYLRRHR